MNAFILIGAFMQRFYSNKRQSYACVDVLMVYL